MPVKPAAKILVILFLFLFPIVFLQHLRSYCQLSIFIFYPFNLLVLFFIFNKRYNEKFSLRYKIDKHKENINILNEEIDKHRKSNAAWLARKERYNKFKKIIENINQDLDLDSVSDKLVSMALSLLVENNVFI